MGAVIIIFCLLIVTVICVIFPSGWCSGSVTDFPVVSLVTKGVYCTIARIFTLRSIDRIAPCADLIWETLVLVLIFTVVSAVTGVSASVFIPDLVGCLGLEGIYGGCGYLCSVGTVDPPVPLAITVKLILAPCACSEGFGNSG